NWLRLTASISCAIRRNRAENSLSAFQVLPVSDAHRLSNVFFSPPPLRVTAKHASRGNIVVSACSIQRLLAEDVTASRAFEKFVSASKSLSHPWMALFMASGSGGSVDASKDAFEASIRGGLRPASFDNLAYAASAKGMPRRLS